MTSPAIDLVRSDPRIRAAYAEGAGIFRIVPAGVALPASIAELQEVIAWARRTGSALVPRGAGSSIPGGAVGEGVILDLRERMPSILEVDPVTRTAVTSANVTQAELNLAAGAHGLRLPPDPSSSGWATLGGMVSTNAAGARTVRHGPVRPWVIGMEVVTAEGEVGWLSRRAPTAPLMSQGVVNRNLPSAFTRFNARTAPAIRAAAAEVRERFPQVRKNTAGYALDQWLSSGDDLDLFIGAEGTLGIVTTIRWRLAPVPRERAGVLVALRSLDDLEPAVTSLLALEPSALELLDRTFLDLIGLADTGAARPELPVGTEAVLLVEFEGVEGARLRGVVGDAVRAVSGLALDVTTALTPEEERRLWALRHAASPILASLPPDRRSMQVIEDGCVPLARLGEYVGEIRTIAREVGITVVIFGHAGDGNVHVNALPELDSGDWLERVGTLFERVSRAVIRLGGTPSGEHGDGRLRSGWLEALYGPGVIALFRQVKSAFDPDGILNPGVKLPAAGPVLSRLKIGPEAAPIPEDIARELREIERTGGYARSRLELA